MNNLERLIGAYYRTEETDRAGRVRISMNITREANMLIRQKTNTGAEIKTFINKTQDDILKTLPKDQYMNRYIYNTDIHVPDPVPVRPLVADNTPEQEVEQLLREADLGFNMISQYIRNNDIAGARMFFNEIINIPASPVLREFNGERLHIQDIIDRAHVMIQNAARAPAIGARGLAAAAAAREPVIPQAERVDPVDILPADIISKTLAETTLEDYKEMMECPICNKHIRNIRIVPCGHTICIECAQRIITETSGRKRCPVCNSDREGFKKAFYAKYLKYKTKYLELKKQN